MATFRIINVMDSLIQNITKIVCLRRFIFDFLSQNPGVHADLLAPIFQNQTSFLWKTWRVREFIISISTETWKVMENQYAFGKQKGKRMKKLGQNQ